MNLNSHLSTLNTKHTELEAEIKYETQRPLPDFMKISELKKRKLAIKTEIASLLERITAASSA